VRCTGAGGGDGVGPSKRAVAPLDGATHSISLLTVLDS